jgi:predicted transcriptional regulator
VVEVWKARGYTTFDLPDAAQAATRDVRSLAEVVMELKLEIRN